MTTTIFPDLQVPVFPGRTDILDQAFNILLAGNYLLVVLAAMSDVGSQYIGGSRQLSPLILPGLLILLTILHLGALIPGTTRVHQRRLLGLALLSSALLTIATLLFSGPSMYLLRVSSPSPVVVFGLLILTACYGIMQVLLQENIHPGTDYADPLISRFPEGLRSRYTEVRFLASGGVGTVWYARYGADGREVAVKIPSRSDEQTGRAFLQEIQLWKELSHPGIAQIYAVNILPVPYVEMEYLPKSLAMIPVPVSREEAIGLMVPVTSALSYAHEQGVVHCDIKPGNILLTRDGIPKITDWGLARGKDSVWAIHGFSTRYAAPEQCGLSPDCGPGVDVYQCGLILAWLLTGRAVLPSGTEPVFAGNEGRSLAMIIARCLEKSPCDRFSDCTRLHEALMRITWSDSEFGA